MPQIAARRLIVIRTSKLEEIDAQLEILLHTGANRQKTPEFAASPAVILAIILEHLTGKILVLWNAGPQEHVERVGWTEVAPSRLTPALVEHGGLLLAALDAVTMQVHGYKLVTGRIVTLLAVTRARLRVARLAARLSWFVHRALLMRDGIRRIATGDDTCSKQECDQAPSGIAHNILLS